MPDAQPCPPDPDGRHGMVARRTCRRASMRVCGGALQSLGIGGGDDQMHVVRQAIAPDFGLDLDRRFRRKIAVQRVILVVEEGRLAPISALRHMGITVTVHLSSAEGRAFRA